MRAVPPRRRDPLGFSFSTGLTLLSLTTIFSAHLCSASSVSASNPPPSASSDLICHTDNPAECYPRIFQATDEFQIVHDDQDLPIGLHVRLNIATGLKEAKINNPNDDIDPALEGLPVDSSSVVIFEGNEEEAEGEGEKAARARIPPNAPAYDPVGSIKPPSDDDEEAVAEAGDFYRTLSVLRRGLDVDGALEMLEDVAHDIYYGLKIAEDYTTVRRLLCLASEGAVGRVYVASSGASNESDAAAAAAVTALTTRRARLAALTLASALQNNPKALAEIERHWPALKQERCGGAMVEKKRTTAKSKEGSEDDNLVAATFRLVTSPTSSSSSSSSEGDDPALVKARVAALDGLLKSDLIRHDFLSQGGMERVLEVLIRSSSGGSSSGSSSGDEKEWEPAARKAGLLVMDGFLDESMGAALGEWPTGRQLADAACEKAATAVDAGCWDWWVRRIADRHRGDRGHWSRELWDKLQEQRRANAKKGAAAGRSEL